MRRFVICAGFMNVFIFALMAAALLSVAQAQAGVPGDSKCLAPPAATQPALGRNGDQAIPQMEEKDWLALAAEVFAKKPDGSTAETDKPSAETKPSARSTEELAKAAQNPLANMISLPFQSNFNFFNIHTHGYDRHTMGYVLNVQPVVPFSLSEEWNLITRTIIPVISQPSIAPGMDSNAGLGDVQFTSFFSPAKSKGITWGVGPVLQFPTATAETLGTGKFSAGPSAVILRMDGPWVYGVLAQNVWSYAGDSDRNDVNQLLVQPFVNYNLPKGWYLTTSPIITADWYADSSERWTVPVGGGIGRLVRIGKLPVNFQLAAYYNVEHPTFGPEWSIRFQIQFLFPSR